MESKLINQNTEEPSRIIVDQVSLKTILDKKYRLRVMTFLIFFNVIYIFSSCSLLIANTQSLDDINSYFYPFHVLDFVGSFAFAVVESNALILAGIVTITEPRFILLSLNCGLTFIAAALFLILPSHWEVTSHWIEFSAQVFLTSIDLIFIWVQFKDNTNPLYKYRFIEIGLVVVMLISSILKLFIYGGVLRIGNHDPEQTAHFLEFIGEIINSLFALVFLITIFSKEQKEMDEL